MQYAPAPSPHFLALVLLHDTGHPEDEDSEQFCVFSLCPEDENPKMLQSIWLTGLQNTGHVEIPE